jgi:hypothetical protein
LVIQLPDGRRFSFLHGRTLWHKPLM